MTSLIQALPLTAQRRTCRAQFVRICQGNGTAALILDYFVSREEMSAEAFSQGERLGTWYKFSVRYGQAVLCYPTGEHTIRKALRLLMDLDYIQAHPANDNRSGKEPQYRLNLWTLYTVLTADMERTKSAAVDGESQGASKVLTFPPAESRTHLRESAGLTSAESRTHLRESADPPPQNRGHESVRESVKESGTTTTSGLSLSSNDSNQQRDAAAVLRKFMNREATPDERRVLAGLWQHHGPSKVEEALEVATLAGKPELRYVKGVLKNWAEGKVRAPTEQTETPEERHYFTAPDDAPRMTAEEMAEVKAQLKAMRRASASERQ